MGKQICHVRNLQNSALSEYLSESDAIKMGGSYISPDSSGWFDAGGSHDLCVSCANCGSIICETGKEAVLSCPDCGYDKFYVVQTVLPPYSNPECDSVNVGRNRILDFLRTKFMNGKAVDPWSRWSARVLDFSISYFLVFFFFVMVSLFDVREMSSVRVLFFTIPGAVALDSLLYLLFGTTLGKWLFAIAITHRDGTELTYLEHFIRNWKVFAFGLGALIPFFAIPLQICQYLRLRSGKAAFYDANSDIVIIRTIHNVNRIICGIGIFVVGSITFFIMLIFCVMR